MVLGYLLLGWVGGATAATLHLAAGGGTLLGALGLFIAIGNLSVVALAALVFLRRAAMAQRAEEAALAAPVPPFPHGGPSPSPAGIGRRGPPGLSGG
jgi:hypothetical protein